ncbi:MAG: MYG1 family protein [Candidatus Melainabacteria bacterium]|nr:MYG1 family protein [Candidatus Melainabacteria bacterium]
MHKRNVGTHDGSFHADEVTACALLLVFGLVDRDKIVRSRDNSVLDECEYVCDVGGIYNPAFKRFDHHQSEYTGEMSSAGMIWLYMKEQRIVDEATYDFFNRSLILGVDAHDNGRVTPEVGTCTFSMVITNFVPPIYDAPTEIVTSAFFDALDFATGHVKRLLERWSYILSCQEKVAVAMQKKEKHLYFDEAMPWMECFFELGGETHPALFVVMPSGGHWKVRGIPPTMDERMKVRMPLPQEWAGLLGEDLKRVSGIAGAIFCHKGRFISVWETKADAYKALEYILNRMSHDNSVR